MHQWPRPRAGAVFEDHLLDRGTGDVPRVEQGSEALAHVLLAGFVQFLAQVFDGQDVVVIKRLEYRLIRFGDCDGR